MAEKSLLVRILWNDQVDGSVHYTKFLFPLPSFHCLMSGSIWENSLQIRCFFLKCSLKCSLVFHTHRKPPLFRLLSFSSFIFITVLKDDLLSTSQTELEMWEVLSLQKLSRWRTDIRHSYPEWLGFPGGSEGEESACNAGDPGSIPGSGRSPEEGNGNSFQYSCLENTMDRGAW